MLNNVIIKKALKNTVFRLLNQINKIVPKRDNFVLLYIASEGLRHNLKPLLEYLVEKEYTSKYNIICAIESLKYSGEKNHNVIYITKIRGILMFMLSRHVFYTAGQIPIKPSKDQIVIHMNHGTCDYKTMGKLTKINNGDEFYFNYILTTGDYYVPIVAKEYDCQEANVFVCSEPTTDSFYRPLKQIYDLGCYDKILLWLPTFKQSETLNYNDSMVTNLIPCFEENDYKILNNVLRQYNYKLIVKLHGAQVLKQYRKMQLSNLHIYSNADFLELGYDLYQFLQQVDVLIGDYSSVSLQFLLLDKPLAYVIPDIDSYKEHRGFVFENPEEYMPGYKIKSKEEFYQFLQELATGQDIYKDERKRVKKIIHKYDDGRSCERILKLSEINK